MDSTCMIDLKIDAEVNEVILFFLPFVVPAFVASNDSNDAKTLSWFWNSFVLKTQKFS